MAGDRKWRTPNANAKISNGIDENAEPTERHAYCMLYEGKLKINHVDRSRSICRNFVHCAHCEAEMHVVECLRPFWNVRVMYGW